MQCLHYDKTINYTLHFVLCLTRVCCVFFYSCNSTSDITRFFSFHFAVAEISSPTKYRWHISECINVATTQRTEFEHDATREIKRRWWSHSNSINNNVQLNAREPNRHSTSSINKSMNNRQQCHLYSSHFFSSCPFFLLLCVLPLIRDIPALSPF